MEEEITIWKKGDIIYGIGFSGLIKIYKVKKASTFIIPWCVELDLEGLFIKENIQILIEDTKITGDLYEGQYYANTAEKVYTFWNTTLKNIKIY